MKAERISHLLNAIPIELRMTKPTVKQRLSFDIATIDIIKITRLKIIDITWKAFAKDNSQILPIIYLALLSCEGKYAYRKYIANSQFQTSMSNIILVIS